MVKAREQLLELLLGLCAVGGLQLVLLRRGFVAETADVFFSCAVKASTVRVLPKGQGAPAGRLGLASETRRGL